MPREKIPKDLSALWFPRDYRQVAAADSDQNRRFVKADKRFLIIRHYGYKPFFYYVLLNWLEREFPDIRSLFELHLLPCYIRDWSRYILCIPWLQDPVQTWSKAGYWFANRIDAQCDKRGIPIINRVDRLTNAGKSTAAHLISSLGIRTPKMALIKNKKEFRETRLGLNLPLFVREDWGHRGIMIRANTPEEVRQIPLHRFIRPVAVELIDVQDPKDGLYRKYRYAVAGDVGTPKGLVISKEWVVKGNNALYNEVTRQEEVSYLNNPDLHHNQLVAARKALGLDFVAFDYSYDRQGRMVVWEANPYPYIRLSKGVLKHAQPALYRTLAAMVKLYLDRAGLATPKGINDLLASPCQGAHKQNP